ncbi:MAG TPA: RNase H family protein [Methanoregulaceae archaeon]|nr:RNase H family protein [Methanoregulaceae archaeon]
MPSGDEKGPKVPGRLEIMVDGSGDGHSVAMFPGDEVFFMYEKGASNNEAEFNAIILALENLPGGSHARIRTDSQTVVWHLTSGNRSKPPAFVKKAVQIQELIINRELTIEIQWIPRKLNAADRLLKQYVASLCGAGGREPMYQKIRRLEAENNRLKARLRNVMRLLKARPEACPDACVAMDVLEM